MEYMYEKCLCLYLKRFKRHETSFFINFYFELKFKSVSYKTSLWFSDLFLSETEKFGTQNRLSVSARLEDRGLLRNNIFELKY